MTTNAVLILLSEKCQFLTLPFFYASVFIIFSFLFQSIYSITLPFFSLPHVAVDLLPLSKRICKFRADFHRQSPAYVTENVHRSEFCNRNIVFCILRQSRIMDEVDWTVLLKESLPLNLRILRWNQRI